MLNVERLSGKTAQERLTNDEVSGSKWHIRYDDGLAPVRQVEALRKQVVCAECVQTEVVSTSGGGGDDGDKVLRRRR